jgi:hypothetical protein
MKKKKTMTYLTLMYDLMVVVAIADVLMLLPWHICC